MTQGTIKLQADVVIFGQYCDDMECRWMHSHDYYGSCCTLFDADLDVDDDGNRSRCSACMAMEGK